MTTTIDNVANIAPSIQYIATAGQTVFPYPFPITAASDIVVNVNGATISTYTLTGVGNDTGGNVTLVIGSTLNDIVTIYRAIAIQRATQFGQNAGFSSAAFNSEFNKIYLLLQQLQASDALSLSVPNTNAGNPVTVLTPGAYAGKYLSFDANGNPTPALLTTSGSLTQSIIAGLLTPRTPIEVAAAVVPTVLQPAPYNVLRYGADPTGVALSTTAFNSALAVAIAGGSGVVYVPAGTYLVGALTVTMPGAGGDPRVGPGLHIYGDGVNATIIKQSGSPAGQLLNIQSSNPTTTLANGHVLLENFTLFGVGKTCHGLSLQGIADWQLRSVQIHDFDRGLNLQSTLIGHCEGNWAIFSNNTGIFGGTGGTPSPTNLISFTDGRLLANTAWGADFGNGSSIRFNGTDIENNGTTSNTSTGAIVLRSTLSSGFSFAQVSFDDAWFEGNQGQCFKAEAITGLNLSFKDCLILGSDAGRDVLVAGAQFVSFDSCNMATASPVSVSNITSNYLYIKNSIFNTLTDNAATPYYENVVANGAVETWGRHTQWTGTLTGCTTSPTTTIDTYQQGDEVRFNFFTSLNATSNTTACSITGCPTALKPPFTRGDIMCVMDNGVQQARYCQLTAAGVLNLSVGIALTNTGAKGVDVCQFRYRLGA